MKKRVNLGPDSAGALEPRERVTALWLSLVRKKLLLQGVTIEEININESDPGKCVELALVSIRGFINYNLRWKTNLL